MNKPILKQKFLAGIFKNILAGEKRRGAILIMAILVLGIMLFVGGYFLSISLTGSKMAQSHEASTRAYYLAEAGVQEAIFKLKNDLTWKSAFETLPSPGDPACSLWSIAPYSRTSALTDGGSYELTIANLGCAKAEITSKAKIQTASGRMAQKIVKIKVFKALVGGLTSEFALLASGASENLEISSANPFNVHGGSLFTNNNVQIKNWSVVNVENKLLAVNNLSLLSGSQLFATSCAKNICETGCATSTDECPPPDAAAPPLNFSEGPDSYLSYAQNSDCSSIRSDGKTNCVFAPDEFEKVMWAHYPELSLPYNVTVYVTGDVNVRAGQDLTVQGVLAADRDINLGQDFCWFRTEPPFVRCGSVQLEVIRPGLPDDNFPSGLLAQRKINTGGWFGIGLEALNITGLIYAGDEAKIASLAAPIEIHGGIVARKFSFSSLWNGVDIYLDSDVIVDTFRDAEYSPVITIDHWEEKY